MRNQHVDLPELGDDLFRIVLLLGHSFILHLARKPTSGRTTFQGAGHNQKAANVIRLQLLTGARIGEVLSLRWDDVDLDRGVWIKPSHHTKQKRTEHLPLSGAAVALLAGLRATACDPNGLVFPGRSPDKPIVDLRRFWKSATSAAGIEDYRIHDNRHTHASHLVSSGMSLAVVGRLLGHTNPMTTQRYAHLAADPLREAADVFGRKSGL